MLNDFIAALMFQAGPNATSVTLGVMALGFCAGVTGTFLTLRKRALVSDALAHATLPGIGLAFIVTLFLGMERSLPVLLIGAACSSLVALYLLQALVKHTKLGQDSAIGAILSCFYGAGIVILTFIQGMRQGRQAGLENFLLGSTAGMLRMDVIFIICGGLCVLLCLYALRRPLLFTAFDEGAARVSGLNISFYDSALMLITLGVVLLGLRVVGLVLIVALLITPAITARLWSHNIARITPLAGLLGALSAWLGAALSASLPNMPTGPVIVVISFMLLMISLPFNRLRQ